MSQVGALLAFLSIFSPVVGRNSLLDSPLRAGIPDPLVTSTGEGLILEWYAPPPDVRLSPGGSAVIEMPGYAQSDWPGAPILPVTSAWIALPPGAEPAIEVLDKIERDIDLPAPLSLAPSPEGVLRDPAGQVAGGLLVPSSHPAPFPGEVVALEEAGVVRGQRLASLRFYPLRPSGQGLRLTEYARVEVRFNSPLQPAAQEGIASDPILSLVDRQVVNSGQLQPAYPDAETWPPYEEALASPQVRAAVQVSQVGITEITYAALKTIGFPVDAVNPQNLRLARAGQQVAIEWGGDSDNQFKPGEHLLFFAEPRFSRWTGKDMYFLWEGSTPGARMGSRSALLGSPPAGTAWTELTFEQNIFYTPDCYCAPIPAGRDGDRWTWDNLQVPSRVNASYTFTLPAIDSSEGGMLTVWLIGYTDLAAQPDHRVESRLNGTLLGSQEWDGKQAVEVNLDIPSGVLQSGQNILKLSLPEDRVEGMWLDAFRVRFARGGTASAEALLFQGEATQHAYTLTLDSIQNLRAYDVTSVNQPVLLEGLNPSGNNVTLGDPADGNKHRYWLSSRVENPQQVRLAVPLRTNAISGADYLAIAPAAFIHGLDDLVQLRQGQGLQVAVEDVQAIYDTFGDGRPDPAAIQAFLVQAYQAWNPRPVYVLLVGDGTSDPKLYNSTSSQTFIPPFLAEVDPWAGETASDNRYATVDGSDVLPDLLIGRLPANSLSEVETMVAKIVSYEAQAAPQAWSAQGLFVTDNPDRAGDFPGMSEKVIHALPTQPLLSRRLYYDAQQDSEQDIRDRLHSSWNEGAGLIMYTGHASILQWAVERFLEIEAIPTLKNGDRLPVVLEMTCFTGSFQVPGFQTMDESLLRQPGGGAVAAWGSTGLGLMTGHRWLAEGFLAELYGSSQATIGEAALAGKLNLSREGLFYEDLIDTFTLLGDPALQIIRSDYHYLPVILQSP